MTRFPYSRCNL